MRPPFLPLLAVTVSSRLWFGLGWVLLVVTASVLAWDAHQSARLRSREGLSHGEYRRGCLLVPGGTVVGVALAVWLVLRSAIRADDFDKISMTIFAGSLLGVAGCFAYWGSGLVWRWIARPFASRRDEGGDPPPVMKGKVTEMKGKATEARVIDGKP